MVSLILFLFTDHRNAPPVALPKMYPFPIVTPTTLIQLSKVVQGRSSTLTSLGELVTEVSAGARSASISRKQFLSFMVLPGVLRFVVNLNGPLAPSALRCSGSTDHSVRINLNPLTTQFPLFSVSSNSSTAFSPTSSR